MAKLSEIDIWDVLLLILKHVSMEVSSCLCVFF